MTKRDGYLESEEAIVTWCVGHLVTMSYPEVYDEKLKKWSMDTLPFIPKEFKYEVISSVAKQFKIVSSLLNRPDVETIYVCTDSGREGEYIYRLVEQMAGVKNKKRLRVWIDSQTKEEILKGVREAKDLSEYDNLSNSAFLRAKEDYLMGINFSRLLTLRYSSAVASFLNERHVTISVGRVMTCVLGMVVRREREIRRFVKTPFYKVVNELSVGDFSFKGEWRVTESSEFYGYPKLYKENGFLIEEDANKLILDIKNNCKSEGLKAKVLSVNRKKENKNAPTLFNLAELQNLCSRFFKISPDQTLKIVQELYEKKLVTYPRTDARVLSTAVAKEIDKNIKGLMALPMYKQICEEIFKSGSYKGIAKTRYTNDKQITDHYAIIPTGQGFGSLRSLGDLQMKVYETIVRRFLAIFFPPAVYQKTAVVCEMPSEKKESFYASFKVCTDEGFLKAMNYSFFKDKQAASEEKQSDSENEAEEEIAFDEKLLHILASLKKGDELDAGELTVKAGETSPPKRYTSGSMVLAMENAGQLIEDEELRSQIKGSGIGTSATRAEIIAKLVRNKYLDLNKKTQVITPTLLGEMIHDVVYASIRSLLNPELTASWEKGLTYVAEGSLTSEEYMVKLSSFINRHTDEVKSKNYSAQLQFMFRDAATFYKPKVSSKSKGKTKNKADE